MSDVETVDDDVTRAKMQLLRDKVREHDEVIRRLNHIMRQLDLTTKYQKEVITETDGVTTTTSQFMKRMDSHTDDIITDEERLKRNTLWLAKADTALGA